MAKWLIGVLGVLAAVCVAFWALVLWPERDVESSTSARTTPVATAPANEDPQPSLPSPGEPPQTSTQALEPIADTDEPQIEKRFAEKMAPRAGLLFDVDTGEVLWSLNPRGELPIASLTKMMTALVIAENHELSEEVAISEKASGAPGSGIGNLPKGKSVRLRPLLFGLMLVSGNDAAVALAEHDAGTAPAFVEKMNQKAEELGLDCTHFTTPNGLRDKGNYSCVEDLAQLARIDLGNETIAGITKRYSAVMPFPVKGGKLHLTNNNPFILKQVPGVTGLKTGYTSLAGRCYVTTQRIGDSHLGVVLLNSPDPLRQVPELLEAGFVEMGAIPPPPPPAVKPDREAAPRNGTATR